MTVDELGPAAVLARGDRHEVAGLVAEYYPGMLRFAQTLVPSSAAAEDVVQETWIAVLGGLEGFEGRSGFRTWLYAVLRNKAYRTTGQEIRLRRYEVVAVPEYDGQDDPHGIAGRMHPPGHPDAGHWSMPPEARFLPETAAVNAELGRVLAAELGRLPDRQRQVVLLREVDGLTASEVEELAGIPATTQRSLLHRARARLRGALECYMTGQCADPTHLHAEVR